jgi:putative endonuclease
MFYVYLLQSLKDSKLYIGSTADLKRRLNEHNRGQSQSTRLGRPWKLIYYEAYLDKRDADGREKFLKGGSGKQFINKQLKHYLGGVAQPVRAAES